MSKTKESDEDRMFSCAKQHDSVMNGIDSNLQCSTGMSWLELYNTQEYNQISVAVWNLVHHTYTLKEEDD